MSTGNVARGAVLAPEDEGRLQLYALLARLFAAGPDERLLRALAQSAGSIEGDGDLAQAWNQVAAAAAETSARDATLEFDATFIGVGKAPVSTYLSHYHPGARKEAVLVELRDTLARLGLARTAASAEPEDNLTAVLEVMRHLVAAGSDVRCLQQQREFFARYLQPVYRGFCDAAHKSELSNYYKAAVRLLEVFVEADLAQFEMSELMPEKSRS
jgi:TorA maturation chaperone TorD